MDLKNYFMKKIQDELPGVPWSVIQNMMHDSSEMYLNSPPYDNNGLGLEHQTLHEIKETERRVDGFLSQFK